MKKLFFALMAVAAIAIAGTFAGCKNHINEPETPENIPSRLDTTPPQTEIDGRRVNAPLRFPGAE